MRKFSSILAIVLVLLLVGCSTGPSSTPGGSETTTPSQTASSGSKDVTINLWAGFTGADKQAMQGMVDNFMKENAGITVNFYSAPWNEMFAKFATAFGTDAGPDVLIMHATDIPNYATRDMLTPLDDLKDELGVNASSYAKAIWDGNSYKGTQWGIPLDYHPMAVFKNVEAFEKAGLDPNAEFKTKEEFLDAARKLTVKDGSGNVIQYGIGIGADHAHTMRYWYGLLFQAGGKFLDETETKSAFDSEAGIKALQFLSDLVHVEKVAPYHESDIDRDFLSGTIAMVIEGPWFIPTVNETDMNVVTSPFPQIFENKGVWAGSHTLTIPAYSASPERKAAATKLIKYITQNSIEWGKASGQIPASFDIADSDAYKNLDNYKYFKAFVDQAEFVHYEPLIPKTAELGADNQLSPVLNAIYTAVRGEATAAEAMKTAAENTDNILK